MCGIAGYFGQLQMPSKTIQKCLSLMQRRGPNNTDFYCHKHLQHNVYLLHSRLSIIDLEERSHQPYCYNSKALVYNGELYNYLELKKNIPGPFQTQSDTEVLIKTIDLHNNLTEALDKCEGMWAFAVYDEKKGSLTLSRDRFGEKPLYFLQTQDGVYFGSEIKFIAALGQSLDINYNHLYRYLVNGYKSIYKTKERFFKGIQELPNASFLTVDCQGKIVLKSYWKPFFAPNNALKYEDIIEKTREVIIRSMRLRLRADVPIAFCMSGGVDSNTLISVAKNVCNYNVHGFTIVNTDQRYEEQKIVNACIKELDIKHTAVPINNQNFLQKLQTLVIQHDAPVYTISYFAHWQLMEKIAQHGYKISVSGTAADELFTGYYDHHLMYLHEIYNDSCLYEKSEAAWLKHIKPIVRNPFLQKPKTFIENSQMRDHIFLDAKKFADYLKVKWGENFTETEFTPSLLRNRMINELFYESVPVILHEDDLNAMYYSIENRSPFLDRELFEFCATIPSKYLINNAYNKAILREAMRSIVPDIVIDERKKVGFNAPILDFLDLKNPQIREFLLDNSPIFEHIHREKIETLTTKEFLLNSESKFLFYFLNAKIFVETYGNL